MPIYHKDVWMPKRIRGLFPTSGSKRLTLSNHAQRRVDSKEIILPDVLSLADCELIELEVMFGHWVKAVIRGDMGGVDYVLVVMKTDVREVWFVKTAWKNDSTDNHATLDSRPYKQAA